MQEKLLVLTWPQLADAILRGMRASEMISEEEFARAFAAGPVVSVRLAANGAVVTIPADEPAPRPPAKPEPAKAIDPHELKDLIRQATGKTLSVTVIRGWTEAEKAKARTWARKVKDGKISDLERWPEHVSAALPSSAPQASTTVSTPSESASTAPVRRRRVSESPPEEPKTVNGKKEDFWSEEGGEPEVEPLL